MDETMMAGTGRDEERRGEERRDVDVETSG
jgi:hypothetical protein